MSASARAACPPRLVRGLPARRCSVRVGGHDEQLQEAIRQQLAGRRRESPDRATPVGHPLLRRGSKRFLDERRKLPTLHYAGQISAELFAEQEAILTVLSTRSSQKS